MIFKTCHYAERKNYVLRQLQKQVLNYPADKPIIELLKQFFNWLLYLPGSLDTAFYPISFSYKVLF
ncbi:hypothetical protein [Carboxylicivirga taeanensis]|uniref:hypothetical protein n=1 Tax=Carboxylicivirga taeanensis TaxID=1416875 RepID=UPI003F6E0373